MIELLNKWKLRNTSPAFNDLESATTIEMVATLHSKMNELINEYNSFVDNVNNIVEDFKNSTTKDLEAFEVALRQEFEDFIDIVALHIQAQDKDIEEAVKYMKTSIVSTTQKIVEEALKNETINAKLNFVTPQMFGAVGDGVTDDYNAIMACYDFSVENNKSIYFPSGEYYVSQGLIFPTLTNLTMDGTVIFTGSGTGLTIGESEKILTLKDIKVRIKNGSTVNENANGILLINVYYSKINVNLVSGYNIGVELRGENAGFSNNTIYTDLIVACNIGLKLNSIGTGWNTDNIFIGGYIQRYTSTEKNNIAILLTTENEYSSNNNVFHKIDVENSHIGVQCDYARYCHFYDMRTENCDIAVSFLGDSGHNVFDIGYGVTTFITTKLNDITQYGYKTLLTQEPRKHIYSVNRDLETFVGFGNSSICRNLVRNLTTNYLYGISKDGNAISIRNATSFFVPLNIYDDNTVLQLNVASDNNNLRYLLHFYNENNEEITEAPITLSASSFWNTSSGYTSSVKFFPPFKVPTGTKKVLIGVEATSDEVIRDFEIVSSVYASVLPYKNVGVSSIPITEGYVGQFVGSSNDVNNLGWVYKDDTWVEVAMPN